MILCKMAVQPDVPHATQPTSPCIDQSLQQVSLLFIYQTESYYNVSNLILQPWVEVSNCFKSKNFYIMTLNKAHKHLLESY